MHACRDEAFVAVKSWVFITELRVFNLLVISTGPSQSCLVVIYFISFTPPSSQQKAVIKGGKKMGKNRGIG